MLRECLRESEWRRRTTPPLGALAGQSTEGTWDRGVTGAAGAEGAWGTGGGDAEGSVFDMVTLETKFSCRERGMRERKNRYHVREREREKAAE